MCIRDSLVLVPLTGKFEPRIDADGQQSPKGRKSIDTYGLYRTLLEQGRRNAWVALKALLGALELLAGVAAPTPGLSLIHI